MKYYLSFDIDDYDVTIFQIKLDLTLNNNFEYFQIRFNGKKVRNFVCIHTHTHTYARAPTHTHTHTHIHTHTYVHTHTHTHTHIYIYIYIWIDGLIDFNM